MRLSSLITGFRHIVVYLASLMLVCFLRQKTSGYYIVKKVLLTYAKSLLLARCCRRVWSCNVGKPECTEKTHLSGIVTCHHQANSHTPRLGIEPWTHWWEASALLTALTWKPSIGVVFVIMQNFNLGPLLKNRLRYSNETWYTCCQRHYTQLLQGALLKIDNAPFST